MLVAAGQFAVTSVWEKNAEICASMMAQAAGAAPMQVVINIHGAPGQDVDDIQRQVEQGRPALLVEVIAQRVLVLRLQLAALGPRHGRRADGGDSGPGRGAGRRTPHPHPGNPEPITGTPDLAASGTGR